MRSLKYIFVGIGTIAAAAIAIFIYIMIDKDIVTSFYYVAGSVILLIFTGIAVHYLGDISSSDE